MKYKDLEVLEDENLKKLIDDALIIFSEINNRQVYYDFFDSKKEINKTRKIFISLILSLYKNDFEGYFAKTTITVEDILKKIYEPELQNIIKIVNNLENYNGMLKKENVFNDFAKFLYGLGVDESNINFLYLIKKIENDSHCSSFIRDLSDEDKASQIIFMIQKYAEETDLICEESTEDLNNSIFTDSVWYSFGSLENIIEDNNEKEKTSSNKNMNNQKSSFSSIFGGNLFSSQNDFLTKNGINLNEKDYKYDPVIGREDIIRKCAITLETPNKSVLLIGPHGVGKTAIVEGIAKGIIDGKFLKDKQIIEISASSLISGKGIVGSFEEGIEDLLNEIEERENIILFIDEIHQIYNMGTSSESNIMNMFKKPISEGKLKLIGATTKNEYNDSIKYDDAFVDRFDVYEVSELKQSIIKDIIVQRIKYLEEYYKIDLPFNSSDQSRFNDYLIKLTDRENRKLNQMSYNPRLVIQLLDTIFATAKVNGHDVIQKEDIVEAVTSNTKIKSDRYKIPNLYHEENSIEDTEKPKVLNNIIDFQSYINKK